MKTALCILMAILLTGCGTYQLGYVNPQQGKTQDQLLLAMMVCKDKAKNEANTDERVFASFLAGLTIIGAPIAIQATRDKEREVFSRCMADAGYTVTPPNI